MKTSAVVFSLLLTGASAFGVVPRTTQRVPTSLSGSIPEAEMTAGQLEIKKIQDKWSEVRLMDADEAANLEPEWKEAYDRFYEKYNKDMDKMMEIATKVQSMIEPPKVEKKSKGQKRRDAYAKVVAREAARAAKK